MSGRNGKSDPQPAPAQPPSPAERKNAFLYSMPGHNGYVTILLALLTLAQTITIDSPRDYQVFQRQTRDSGLILLKGTTTSQTLEVRLPHRRWTRIPVHPATHRFDAALPAPAGGFY